MGGSDFRRKFCIIPPTLSESNTSWLSRRWQLWARENQHPKNYWRKLYWKNNGSCRFVDTSWYSKCCKTTTNCLHSYNNITHYHTCIILVIFSSQTNFAVIRTLHHSGPLTFNWVLPTFCDSDHTLIDCLTYLPLRKNILCTSSCL